MIFDRFDSIVTINFICPISRSVLKWVYINYRKYFDGKY